MGFTDDLKTYLLEVSRTTVDEATSSMVTLPAAWIRKELVHLFEQLEKQASTTGKQPNRIGKLSLWQEDDRGVRFANKLAALLQNDFLTGATQREMETAIQVGIARTLGLTASLGSGVRDAVLDRLCDLAWMSTPTEDDDWRSASRYALEIGATRRLDRHLDVGAIGRIALGLTGRDVVRWLLSVELALSTGPYDDWRLARTTAVTLLEKPRRVAPEEAWPQEPLGHSWLTIHRLDALGVLTEFADGEVSGYELTPFGEEVLRAVVAETETPFSVLARALTQDSARATMSRIAGVPMLAGVLASTEATALQARFFAHEIRNALPPVLVALESMAADLKGTEAAVTLARYSPRINGGIERVFTVVTRMQELTELAVEPPERFDLWSAIRDAVSEVGASNGTRIHLPDVPGPLPAIMGHRARMVLTFTNLLRNAQQVHAKTVRISANASPDGSRVAIDVDDDGPGVPAEQRSAIFGRGVTLRPGGSGQGLALVREVIEKELGGRADCVASSLGGARFHIEFPIGVRSEQ